MENHRSFVALMISIAAITTMMFVLVQFILPYKAPETLATPKPDDTIIEKVETETPEEPDYIEGPAWDSTNYNIKSSWWYFVDLSIRGEVWVEADQYSEDKFISAFDKFSADYKEVRVSLKTSPQTNRRFLNRLTAHLKRANIPYDFYKSPIETEIDQRRAEFEKEKEAAKRRGITPETERIFVALKINGNLVKDDKEYSLNELVAHLKRNYRGKKYKLEIYAYIGTKTDVIRTTDRRLTAKGIDYSISVGRY